MIARGDEFNGHRSSKVSATGRARSRLVPVDTAPDPPDTNEARVPEGARSAARGVIDIQTPKVE